MGLCVAKGVQLIRTDKCRIREGRRNEFGSSSAVSCSSEISSSARAKRYSYVEYAEEVIFAASDAMDPEDEDGKRKDLAASEGKTLISTELRG